MSWFVVTSLVAVALKLLLLWFARARLARNPTLSIVLCSLVLMNAIELWSFFLTSVEYASYEWLMRIYYVAAILLCAGIVDLSLQSATKTDKSLKIANLLVAYVLCVFTAAPNVVVAGVEPMGELVTRVPGPGVYLWHVYIVITLAISDALLVHGKKHACSWFHRRRCVALFLGLTPFIVASLMIFCLMALNFNINAQIVMPVVTTILMFVIVRSDSQYNTFKLLAAVPSTAEYRARRRLSDLYQQIQMVVLTEGQESRLKELLKDFELESISVALLANEGNVSRTAKALGISTATVYRKSTADRSR